MVNGAQTPRPGQEAAKVSYPPWTINVLLFISDSRAQGRGLGWELDQARAARQELVSGSPARDAPRCAAGPRAASRPRAACARSAMAPRWDGPPWVN